MPTTYYLLHTPLNTTSEVHLVATSLASLPHSLLASLRCLISSQIYLGARRQGPYDKLIPHASHAALSAGCSGVRELSGLETVGLRIGGSKREPSGLGARRGSPQESAVKECAGGIRPVLGALRIGHAFVAAGIRHLHLAFPGLGALRSACTKWVL